METEAEPPGELPASIHAHEPIPTGIELTTAEAKCYGFIPGRGRCESYSVYLDHRTQTKFCANCGKTR